MSARRVPTALVVVAFMLFLVPALFAQDGGSHARIVRLSYLDGTVTIDRNDGQPAEKAILNMPIIEGTRLTAEENSRLEVEFENGSTVRLTGPGELVFGELSLRGTGDKVSYVDVKSGIAYFDVRLKNDDDFRVAFDRHNFAVRKPSHFRVNVDLDVQKLAVFKGELQLQGVANEVSVKKEETISFDSADSQRYYLAKGYDQLGPDEWDHDRSKDRDTFARSQDYKEAYSYYGGPYSYGTYDLARYGSFFYNNGYGWLWQPNNWGMGSNPFDYGAWSYYPAAGWVFVSGYPWGWTPYRYGGWVFVPNFGWCWRPGGYNYGWYPTPVVYNAPANYQPPTPPSGGPGPTRFVGGRRWPTNPSTGPANDSGGRFRRPPNTTEQKDVTRTHNPPAATGTTGANAAQPTNAAPTATPGKVWANPNEPRPGSAADATSDMPNMKPQALPRNLPPQSAPPPRHVWGAPQNAPSRMSEPAGTAPATKQAPASQPAPQSAPQPAPRMSPPPPHMERPMSPPPSMPRSSPAPSGKSSTPH